MLMLLLYLLVFVLVLLFWKNFLKGTLLSFLQWIVCQLSLIYGPFNTMLGSSWEIHVWGRYTLLLWFTVYLENWSLEIFLNWDRVVFCDVFWDFPSTLRDIFVLLWIEGFEVFFILLIYDCKSIDIIDGFFLFGGIDLDLMRVW